MIGIASQRRDLPRVVHYDDDERRHGNGTSVAGTDDEIHDGSAICDRDVRPTAKDGDVAEKDPAPTEETLAAFSSSTTAEEASRELAGPARERINTEKEQSSCSARDHVGRRAGETITKTKRSRPGKTKSGEHPKQPPPPREPRRKQKNPPKQIRDGGRDGHDNGDDDNGDDGDLPDMTGKIITVDFNDSKDIKSRRRRSDDDGRLPDFTGKLIVVERQPGGPDDRDRSAAAASDDPPPPADIDLDDLITQERESLSRGVSYRSVLTNQSRSRSWRTHRSSNGGTSAKSSFTTTANHAAATASRIESLLKCSSIHHRNSQRSILSHRTGDSESCTAARSIATGGPAGNTAAAAASAAAGVYPHMTLERTFDVARMTRRSSYQSFTASQWIDERTNEESSQGTTSTGGADGNGRDSVQGNALQETVMSAISEKNTNNEDKNHSQTSQHPPLYFSNETVTTDTLKNDNQAHDESHDRNDGNGSNHVEDGNNHDAQKADSISPLRLSNLLYKPLSGTTTFKTSNTDLSTSLHTRDSHRSKKSQRSKTSNATNHSHCSDTTHTGNATDRSPEFVRSQARFKFQRGCHYAERGDYSKSRERFLTALRYTVMDVGPAHPRVAMIHECLGHVEVFRLEEEVRERQRLALDDWGRFLETTEGGDGVDNSNSSNVASDGENKSRETNFGETSAMHFRTALDILGASDVASGTISAESVDKLKVVTEGRELSAISISDRTFDNSGTITMDELDQLLFGQAKVHNKITPFQLGEMADLYSALTKDEGDDFESSNPHGDQEQIRAEIICRITNILDFLVQEYGVPSIGKSFVSAASFLKMSS